VPVIECDTDVVDTQSLIKTRKHHLVPG